MQAIILVVFIPFFLLLIIESSGDTSNWGDGFASSPLLFNKSKNSRDLIIYKCGQQHFGDSTTNFLRVGQLDETASIRYNFLDIILKDLNSPTYGQCRLQFEAGASSDFVQGEDFQTSFPARPDVYTMSRDGVQLIFNKMPSLGVVRRVNLRVDVNPGDYELRFDSLESFSADQPIRFVNVFLIDTATNSRSGQDTVQNLRVEAGGNSRYRFSVSQPQLSTGRFILVVDGVTSSESEKQVAVIQQLRLWPNPARGSVNVFCQEEGVLELMDLQGRLIKSKPVRRHQQAELQLSSLHKGTYQVRLGREVKELIIE